MRQSRKFLLVTLAAVMALSFAFVATAHAKKVKRVDNIIVFLDQSGSMAMTHDTAGQKKIDMAIETINGMNKSVPAELDYTGAMYTFAPFKEIIAPKAFTSSAIPSEAGKLETEYEIFARRTPMGDDTMKIDPVLSSMSGRTVVVMFTDGESNVGSDPVASAQALRDKYGDNLCLQIVSVADSAEGEQTIEQIRSIFPCSVPASAESLAKAGAMDDYASKVFYKEEADEPMAKAAPVPAPTPAAAEVVSFALNFGFDKYQITDEMIPVLEQAKMILEEDPNAMYEVAGHTDSTGTDAYNQGLSERRAASVVKWLTDNGISADRLEAKGYGESMPKYDNGTSEGRKLNRRVEIQTK